MQDMRVKDQILKITSTDYFTAITYAAFEHKAYTCIWGVDFNKLTPLDFNLRLFEWRFKIKGIILGKGMHILLLSTNIGFHIDTSPVD